MPNTVKDLIQLQALGQVRFRASVPTRTDYTDPGLSFLAPSIDPSKYMALLTFLN